MVGQCERILMAFEKRAINVTTTVAQTPQHTAVRGNAVPNPGHRVNKIKIDFKGALNPDNLKDNSNIVKMGHYFRLGFEGEYI